MLVAHHGGRRSLNSDSKSRQRRRSAIIEPELKCYSDAPDISVCFVAGSAFSLVMAGAAAGNPGLLGAHEALTSLASTLF